VRGVGAVDVAPDLVAVLRVDLRAAVRLWQQQVAVAHLRTQIKIMISMISPVNKVFLYIYEPYQWSMTAV
jgi:hypothetical protein